MTPDQQRHLLELFANCSQETLTETEHRDLQDLLQADLEARRLWFLYHDLEMGLKCLTQVPKEVGSPLEEGTFVRMCPERVDIGTMPTNCADSSRVSWIARRRPTIAVVAMLCLSAIVLFGVNGLRRPSEVDRSDRNKIVNNLASTFIIESPTHGTKFTLSEHKGKLIAVHFLLKSECPSCLKLAHDYAQQASSNSEVLHLFLKPDNDDAIKVWAGKISQDGLTDPPVIYRDPDAQLAKAFRIPDGYQFHGQIVHYPALVLLDSSGKELFRYIGENNTDRMWPDEFTAMLAMVTDRN
jgi:peroxiredoxin Q/BCP